MLWTINNKDVKMDLHTCTSYDVFHFSCWRHHGRSRMQAVLMLIVKRQGRKIGTGSPALKYTAAAARV